MTPTHIDTPIRRNAVASTPMGGQFATPVFEVSLISFVWTVFIVCTVIRRQFFVCYVFESFECFHGM